MYYPQVYYRIINLFRWYMVICDIVILILAVCFVILILATCFGDTSSPVNTVSFSQEFPTRSNGLRWDSSSFCQSTSHRHGQKNSGFCSVYLLHKAELRALRSISAVHLKWTGMKNEEMSSIVTWRLPGGKTSGSFVIKHNSDIDWVAFCKKPLESLARPRSGMPQSMAVWVQGP